MNAAPVTVTNNEAEHRYEVVVDGALALLQYDPRGDHVRYLHTEVPDVLEGRGIGSALAKAALDDARSGKLEVVPLCPFVAAYIKRHAEYLDLVEPVYRERLR